MIPRQVKDWMVPNPITIGPQATGAEAEALMEAHRIRHLPVVAVNLLVGMITDRDIRLASMPRPRKEPKHSDALLQLIRVEQLMTRDLVTVTPVTPIGEAARLMLEQRLGALPVLEGERLVGIISQGDLLKALLALLKSDESQGRGMPGKQRRPSKEGTEKVSFAQVAQKGPDARRRPRRGARRS